MQIVSRENFFQHFLFTHLTKCKDCPIISPTGSDQPKETTNANSTEIGARPMKRFRIYLFDESGKNRILIDSTDDSLTATLQARPHDHHARIVDTETLRVYRLIETKWQWVEASTDIAIDGRLQDVLSKLEFARKAKAAAEIDEQIHQGLCAVLRDIAMGSQGAF